MHKIFSLLLCDRLPVKSLIFHTFKTQIDRVVKQISKIRRCKLKFCPLLKFESIFEEMSVSARRILLTDDGTVFVLYNSNARIFTARSAQSREVTADAAAADS